MSSATEPTNTPGSPPTPRDDPAHDLRRVVLYFVGLIAFYAAVIVIARPGAGDISKVAVGLMFAPTVGALTAVAFGRGRIRFGRPTRHLLLAFVPPAVILAATCSRLPSRASRCIRGTC